jgi:hypothetical protein
MRHTHPVDQVLAEVTRQQRALGTADVAVIHSLWIGHVYEGVARRAPGYAS